MRGQCGWCRRELPTTDPRARFCSRRCRQTAFRVRRRSQVRDALPAAGMRFAYADPPYPGLSSKYYRHEPTFAGEVDHAALIASLRAAPYAGVALSTASRSLREILPLCPPDARVCAWTKPIGIPPATRGIHSTWEPVIVWGGRQRPPGVCDWLRALPARGGGELPGRKPVAFCAWLFDLLGMVPGDELDDLYPGSGIVGAAWSHLSRSADRDGRGRFLSLPALDDASPPCRSDGPPFASAAE